MVVGNVACGLHIEAKHPLWPSSVHGPATRSGGKTWPIFPRSSLPHAIFPKFFETANLTSVSYLSQSQSHETIVVSRGSHGMAALTIWTVYRHPRDFPTKWVLRAHDIPGPVARALVETADTLEEIRAKAPPGLHCLPRFPDDNPAIYETWF